MTKAKLDALWESYFNSEESNAPYFAKINDLKVEYRQFCEEQYLKECPDVVATPLFLAWLDTQILSEDRPARIVGITRDYRERDDSELL